MKKMTAHYISKNARGERLSKNPCAFTIQVFPSRTILEVQILEVPKFRSSSKRSSFLPLLTHPQELMLYFCVLFCANPGKRSISADQGPECRSPFSQKVLLSLLSSQVLTLKFLDWLLETCSQQKSRSSSILCAQTSQLFSENEIGLKNYSWRGRQTISVHF